ncbi:heme binding protein [Trichosporon asahii var. asahii CBS 2479]|uniref:Heme binding protein n=1 Tax=Trichosporon asahii var. asahii (strain ATCC 90039 / CBS 2479 / JCM 2466 / KCTC 7840 / NBRC 103889/ NCYC 2677 / UAMH 7654) TaxID=1186058 RepID=J4UC99_TRIAS|nr:heme binding protein [Trichosporon asahii var. asahii CBS 2479]EJT48585.1 heme binding protein [Trichosporon asahii var. asahii CBS 2479]
MSWPKPADDVEEDEEDLDKPPQFPLPGSAQRSAPAPSSESATPPAPALELAPPSPERQRSASPPSDLNIAILPDPIPLGNMAPPPSTTSRPAFGMKAGGGLGPPASAVTQNGGLGVPAAKPAVVKKEKKGRGKVALGPGCSALDWARLTQSGENLRGVEGGLIRVTKEELAKHKTHDDAWSAFNGAVYNITPYLRFHPGGEDELMRVAGRDGTKLFTEPDALLALGQVNQRLHAISQAPILWVRLFSAAGYTLDPESVPKLVAARSPPGRWKGGKWLAGNGKEEGWSLWPSAWLGRLKRRRLPGAGTPPVKSQPPQSSPDTEDQIPVHWPTLFRSRQLAQEESEARGPHPLYNPARDASNPFHPSHFSRPSRPPSGNESEDEFDDSDAMVVYPKQLWQLRDHTAKIYSCAVRGRWLITGARDKCVNIYRLPKLPNDGSKPTAGPELVLREKVHGSSVLHLDFILDVNSIRGAAAEAGLDFPFSDGKNRGLLVTSATETVYTWDILWPSSNTPTVNENGEPIKPPAPRLRKRATLLGSEAPVSDVKLHGPWVCVMYVNGLCRVYSATAAGDAIPLRTVFGGEGCHLMALHAGRVLLAGDERTVEFDLHSGREMGRSKRNTAGRVTSMDWDGDHTALGTAHGTLELSRRLGRHTLVLNGSGQLVRRVLLDPGSNTLVSAGYEGRVAFWDLEAGEMRRAYDLQSGPIFGLAKDGMWLVVTTADRVIVVAYGTGLPYAGLF